MTIPGHGVLIAGEGSWITMTDDGAFNTYSHERFLELFEPADADAQTYLEGVNAWAPN